MKTRADQPIEKRRRGEYISNIVFNLFIIWVFSKVPGWNLSFLRENYMVVLTVLMINCGIQAAGNALLLLFSSHVIMYLIKITLEVATVASTTVLYYLYPFNFAGTSMPWLDRVLPILFILGIIVGIVKIIVFILRLVSLVTENCEGR